MSQHQDRVAIITGGASGMGEATASLLLQQGARVMIGDLNPPDALLRTFGDRVGYLPCDVSDPAQVDALVEKAVSAFGQLDYLFNNAGMVIATPTAETDPASWNKVFAVNCASVFYACHAAIPHLKNSDRAAIVNNASISGMRADYAMPSYNASKAAVVNYTRVLALELGEFGIRANAVCPGVIITQLSAAARSVAPLWESWIKAVPLGRAAAAEEVAQVVLFLLSDAASYVSGAIIPVDGGLTVHTGLPDVRPYLAGIPQ